MDINIFLGSNNKHCNLVFTVKARYLLRFCDYDQITSSISAIENKKLNSDII